MWRWGMRSPPSKACTRQCELFATTRHSPMARLLDMRKGIELRVNHRPVPFSFWPVDASKAPRPPVQSFLFANDPWAVMKRSVTEQIQASNAQEEARSYIDQASDFYQSALQSQIHAAKPLQLYYSYLNIVKAFVLCRGRQVTLPTMRHGIRETLPQGGTEFAAGYVESWTSPDSHGRLQAFDEFLQALECPRYPDRHCIRVTELIPQILPGHRLWAAAIDEKERFLSLQRVQFTQNTNTKKVWLRMYIFRDDLRRLGQTQQNLLEHSRLKEAFRIVKCSEKIQGRELMCLEQLITTSYNRHGVDSAMTLAAEVRNRLWSTVASVPPYRRYYLYLCPSVEQNSILPQLASIYFLTFYLGSVTRYRPTVFRSILDGPYGPRIAEFVSSQAAQFIYLMTSEFAKRDVTQPSIV